MNFDWKKKLRPRVIAKVILILWGLILVLRSSQPTESFVPSDTDELNRYTKNENLAERTDFKIPPVSKSDHIRGGSAPLTVIEYAEFQSDYVRLQQSVMQELLAANTGKVNWVFRHFPLMSHELSYVSGEASECVFVQKGEDAFWQYIDALAVADALDENLITSTAEPLGVDMKSFQDCTEKRDQSERVISDKRALLASTDQYASYAPTFFFVNNATGETRMVEGAHGIEYMQKLVEEMMGK